MVTPSYTQQQFDREWREARNRVVQSLASYRLRLGDDTYLVTVTGRTSGTVSGYAWSDQQ